MAAPEEICVENKIKHLCIRNTDDSYSVLDDEVKPLFVRRTIELIPNAAKIGAFFDHTATRKVTVELANLPWKVSRFNGKKRSSLVCIPKSLKGEKMKVIAYLARTICAWFNVSITIIRCTMYRDGNDHACMYENEKQARLNDATFNIHFGVTRHVELSDRNENIKYKFNVGMGDLFYYEKDARTKYWRNMKKCDVSKYHVVVSFGVKFNDSISTPMSIISMHNNLLPTDTLDVSLTSVLPRDNMMTEDGRKFEIALHDNINKVVNAMTERRKKKYDLDPDEECMICCEKLNSTMPLSCCGQRMHRRCLLKATPAYCKQNHILLKCPFCRAHTLGKTKINVCDNCNNEDCSRNENIKMWTFGKLHATPSEVFRSLEYADATTKYEEREAALRDQAAIAAARYELHNNEDVSNMGAFDIIHSNAMIALFGISPPNQERPYDLQERDNYSVTRQHLDNVEEEIHIAIMELQELSQDIASTSSEIDSITSAYNQLHEMLENMSIDDEQHDSLIQNMFQVSVSMDDATNRRSQNTLRYSHIIGRIDFLSQQRAALLGDLHLSEINRGDISSGLLVGLGLTERINTRDSVIREIVDTDSFANMLTLISMRETNLQQGRNNTRETDNPDNLILLDFRDNDDGGIVLPSTDHEQEQDLIDDQQQEDHTNYSSFEHLLESVPDNLSLHDFRDNEDDSGDNF